MAKLHIIASILVGLAVAFGLVLLIVPGIIFGLWFTLTSQVIVLEGGKATAAMGRSKRLISGNLGKVFGLGFILAILGGIVNWLFQNAGGSVASAIAGEPETMEQIVSTATNNAMIVHLFTTVGEVLFLPISAAAYILLYYDLRIRKEGFDLEMLAKSMSANPASVETQSGDSAQPMQ